MANHDIMEVIDSGTAGANLLCAVVANGKLYYALAGNCRLAVFRKGDLIPLSEGHTIDILAKQSFKTGRISRKDALAALKEQRVYNFVGQDGFKNIEYYDTPVQLQAGDVVVLMTDGVEEIFGAGKIEQLLNTKRSCEEMAFNITDSISKNRVSMEKDNATVMLLRVNSLGR
jgi:serine/threonine protein phosphatase PrpC